MNDESISKMEEKMKTTVKFPDPSAEFKSSLKTQFIRQGIKNAQTRSKAPSLSKGKGFMKLVHTRPLVASLLVLIILLSLTGVVYAISQKLGYIPGFGLVDQNVPVRTVAEPITITREGVTLSVEQVWVDANQTSIQLSVDGLTSDMIATDGGGCIDPANLRFGDTVLDPVQPQAFLPGESGYQLTMIFPTIPSNVDDVIMTMPCVLRSLPGKAPENWEVTLHLVAPPPNAIYPVTEVPTLIPETPGDQTQTPETSAIDGISLVVDRYVALDDGYLLYLSIHWEDTYLGWVEIPAPEALHVFDASGTEIAYNLDLEATSAANSGETPGQTTFAIKIGDVTSVDTLTITLDSIYASMGTDASFIFDPGVDPQPGQIWTLNQVVDVGNGFSLNVVQVKYDLTDGVQAFLSFEMTSDTGVAYAMVVDMAHPNTMAAGGGNTPSTGPFNTDMYYLEPLPDGPLTVSIISVSINLPGPWQVEWTPAP